MLTPGGNYQYLLLQSAAAATGNGAAITLTDPDNGALGTLTMQVSGTFVGTVTFEGTVDGSNWIALLCTNVNAGTTATTATAVGIFRVDCSGLAQVRARVSAYTSGAITVTATAVA